MYGSTSWRFKVEFLHVQEELEDSSSDTTHECEIFRMQWSIRRLSDAHAMTIVDVADNDINILTSHQVVSDQEFKLKVLYYFFLVIIRIW